MNKRGAHVANNLIFVLFPNFITRQFYNKKIPFSYYISLRYCKYFSRVFHIGKKLARSVERCKIHNALWLSGHRAIFRGQTTGHTISIYVR